MLASLCAIWVWRYYLEGSQFALVMDHHPNTFLKTQSALNRRQARWSEIIQPYDFKWEYKPSRTNTVDPLSHILVRQVTTMGEQGYASDHYAICKPQDNQVTVPRPRATSSSMLHRCVVWYITKVDFQKLLPTQRNWEYHGALGYCGDKQIVAGCDL